MYLYHIQNIWKRDGMNINYEYYKIFYHVAKNENITRAAEELNSNQPNVSRVIRLLENELGITLMIRQKRGIRLTPEGHLLYSHISSAVEHITKAESEIQALADCKTGAITIGVSETALYLTLLPALKVFREEYPDIEIRLQNHLTYDAITATYAGRSDFAVVALPYESTNGLITTDITSFQDILIAAPSIASELVRENTLRDICRYPIISMDAGTSTYEFYRDFFQSHGLEFKPGLSAATTDQIIPMVKAGLGIGFVPELYAQDALRSGLIRQIPIEEEIPVRRIALVESREYPLSIAAQALKNTLLTF